MGGKACLYSSDHPLDKPDSCQRNGTDKFAHIAVLGDVDEAEDACFTRLGDAYFKLQCCQAKRPMYHKHLDNLLYADRLGIRLHKLHSRHDIIKYAAAIQQPVDSCEVPLRVR